MSTFTLYKNNQLSSISIVASLVFSYLSTVANNLTKKISREERLQAIKARRILVDMALPTNGRNCPELHKLSECGGLHGYCTIHGH